LDTLLTEVEETEASVEEIEEVFANPTDLLRDIDSYEIDEESEPPATRDRLKH
jgi:t-SNARE complex subunit (syntaxin)